MSLTAVVVAAKTKHTATVLWFHGLGDTGSGWSFLAEELSTLFPYVKWILPNAPVRPIALNGGYPMPAWFDLSGLDKFSLKNEDEAGMLSSISLANKIISKEVDNGIPANRIIVGGFSQGCVLSLLTGLTSEYKLAGIVGCSGSLGLSSKFPAMASDANRKTPILMCHGDEDPVVKPIYGQESAEKLQSMGYNVTRKTYPGLVHSANDKEIIDIAEFLKTTIPPI
ncbi:Phospholipase/carboxylesterase/thioesterase [Mucor mucedo]|uniref:Phospholipase/carboxylesterase/thioesterase n=1 Tax=Mucor mucedo TaxID=29922 RepID=UPI0022202D43|nr:Phospholipase/carboxylesterase/thioesterase [Mucor mucedo]KAI7865202.1 Phospholipase/carboxylesterase/thioesterase [Mucor mucedo]